MNELNLIEVIPKVDDKVIIETLTRIGIGNKVQKVIYPSCYLYKEDGRYYIVHFKELFLLTRENAYNSICEDDVLRKNAVIFCLKNWGLIDIEEEKITPYNKFVFVLPHKEKNDWKISHKINLKALGI